MAARKVRKMLNELILKPIVIVKFGELSLKGKNYLSFVNKLRKNIDYALKEFTGLNLITRFDYLEISDFKNDNLQNIIDILKTIPGISLINVGYKTSRDLDLLKACVSLNINDQDETFKIECKRKDKSYELTSPEIIKILATQIFLDHPNIKVNLSNPKQTIYVEVTKKTFLFYFRKYKGLGGLPVGSSGRILALISGGIDSPVASHMMLKKGMHVDFLTFITPPHTSEKALNKTKKLVQLVTRNGKLCDSKLFVCDFSNILRELNHCDPESYKITIMRRCFFKIAQKIVNKYNYDAIVTGESLGQVASQTIESLRAIQANFYNLFVFRPLIGFDKNEIIDYAKKINTFETSILPYEDACSLFTPKSPITKPNLNMVFKIEKELDLVDILIESVITNHLLTFRIGEITDATITNL